MHINFLNDRRSLGYKCRIDTECSNRLVIITDGKRTISVIIIAGTIFFNCPKPAGAISTSFTTRQKIVSVIQDRDTYKVIKPNKIKIEPSIKPKVMMPSWSKNVKSRSELSLPVSMYLMDERFLRQPEISLIIRQLRGGTWQESLAGNLFFAALFYGVFMVATGGEGFAVPENPGWGLGNNRYEHSALVRPTDGDTRLYAGSGPQSLKNEAARNQPNPKDRFILLESRPELIIRRGQAQAKTRDHGALAGLPYRLINLWML